jgi:hypothetical protein
MLEQLQASPLVLQGLVRLFQFVFLKSRTQIRHQVTPTPILLLFDNWLPRLSVISKRRRRMVCMFAAGALMQLEGSREPARFDN